MSKHTPGPWAIERKPIKSSGGSNTVFVIGPFCACIYDDWRQWEEHKINTAENEANARLIAAAPELLEALQCWPLAELLGMIEDHGNIVQDEMWNLAKLFMEVRDAVISKAKGATTPKE